jgi:hypothetical protein
LAEKGSLFHFFSIGFLVSVDSRTLIGSRSSDSAHSITIGESISRTARVLPLKPQSVSLMVQNPKILYHGSNEPVEVPKRVQQTRKLDFGHGFYLSDDMARAESFAKIVTARRKS